MTGAPAPLLLSVFATFAVGGPQVRFATLANALGPAFRHAIVAMDGDTACAARLDPALDVAFPAVPVRKGSVLANLRSFRRALRTLDPALLLTHNWGSIEWAMANALPLAPHIHIEDGFGPEERAAQIPRRVWLRRLVLRRCTVVVPSLTLLRIARGVWRLPEARLHYIPNGINLARFEAAAAIRPPGAGAVIGTVAALRAEKALGRLLCAVPLLPAEPPARLVIVGEGPERAGLEALAGELGLAGRVLFAGHVEDPAGWYRGFDLFALSSDTEQMPLSVIEAMAAGLPVAATDVGDVRAMLAPANAPHVVAKDEAALAGALAALLADPAARAAIGAANRAKAARDYGRETMIEAYRSLFMQAISGARPDLRVA
jgi:glycosyltransferase involved in cell wall biosynthesis